MNIMNRLTLKHIKKNKARTIVTIIGIIISVAMLTAVMTGMKSGLQWFRNGEIEESGKWHARFDGISMEQFQQLKEMSGMEEVFATKELGYAAVTTSLDETRPYVYIRAYDASAFRNMPIKLVEGRLPENEHEIIISSDLANGTEGAPKVGDTVTYTIGDRFLKETGDERILATYGITKEQPLTQHNRYLDGKSELYSMGDESSDTTTASEELRVTLGEKTYTVVGIIKRPGDKEEPYSTPGMSAYTYLDAEKLAAGNTINGFCYYETVTRKIYDRMSDTAEQLGLGQPTNVNDHVLYYEGVSPDSQFTGFIIAMYVILITIIVIGSVSLIYNTFAISISERSKQLGMLASVGATKKQKRNSVFFEAFIYGVIGIPVGILAGIVGISIAFKVVSNMITGSFPIEAQLVTVVSARTIIGTVVLAVVTILISAYLPARKASKISPIEAIRQTTDIKIKVKKVRTSWITRKLFGFEGELALKNMKRNRKRYRSIIFALVMSVVLFISVSAYLQYVTGAYFMANKTVNYDICLTVYGENQPKTFSEQDKQGESLLKAIQELSSVTTVTSVNSIGLTLNGEAVAPYLSEEMKEYVQSCVETGVVAEEFKYEPYVVITMLDDQSFASYCKEEGIDPQKVRDTKNGIILLNTFELKANYSMKQFPILNAKEGQTLQTKEGTSGETKLAAADLTIAGIGKNLAIGMTEYPSAYYSALTVLAPKSNYKTIYEAIARDNKDDSIGSSAAIYINTTDDLDVEKELETILSEQNLSTKDYDIYNVAQQDRSTRQLVYSVSIFAYGFIILMSMICCANMCNTISTSISLRRTEFAMLKSVGMTPKKFHKMIRFESLLYGIKALLYGVPISLVLSYGLYRYVGSRFTVGFLLPWYIYATAATLVFVVVGVSMTYSSRKVRKENIIDGLKNEIN